MATDHPFSGTLAAAGHPQLGALAASHHSPGVPAAARHAKSGAIAATATSRVGVGRAPHGGRGERLIVQPEPEWADLPTQDSPSMAGLPNRYKTAGWHRRARVARGTGRAPREGRAGYRAAGDWQQRRGRVQTNFDGGRRLHYHLTRPLARAG